MSGNLIVCISCVKLKRASASAAKDLYISPLFQGMYAYALKQKPKQIFILSAKYGLLEPGAVIEPYEKTLKKMGKQERQKWAEDVLSELRRKTDVHEDEFVFLAGREYREGILPHIKHYKIPMEGLKLGPQLRWLKEQAA